MFPIILITGWHGALHLMAAGFWSARVRPGVFESTPASPDIYGAVFRVGARAMGHMIRHGFVCTGSGRAWLCTPGRLP